MPVEVVMPRLGWTMETGRLVEWLKQDGAMVEAGENILSVETDKAVTEVEALESGILRIPPNSPGSDVDLPVGAVLAYLVEPGEPAPFETPAAPSPTGAGETIGVSAADRPSPASHKTAAEATPRSANGEPAVSPRARRIATELSVDWTALQGSGRTGRIVERDVRAAAVERPAAKVVRATPLARRVASEAGVDLDQLAASVGGKRIVRADVEAVAAASSGPPSQLPAEGRPLSPVRRIIGQRMAESAHTTAPVTLTTEADATELVRLRANVVAEPQVDAAPAPSYTAFLARLVAVALLEHPWLNATLSDGMIVEHTAVHIGIAVETERGLLVPVVRDAHLKSVGQIASESTRLIEQVRTNKAAADDLQGGTFTITNLGMYDIDAFTPIINLPECAILGVGRIVARPVVIDADAETVAVRKMMALSLTFDHRVVDGAPAARFLQQVKQWVEHPYRWIMR